MSRALGSQLDFVAGHLTTGDVYGDNQTVPHSTPILGIPNRGPCRPFLPQHNPLKEEEMYRVSDTQCYLDGTIRPTQFPCLFAVKIFIVSRLKA